MSKRPPLLGHNHNVRHAGHLFHVQTEDSGLSRLAIHTHAFVEGTILATLRCTYTVDETDAVVQKRMQDQHKAMLRRVRDGEFDNHPEVLARASQALHAGPPASSARQSAAPAEPMPEAAAANMRMTAKTDAKAVAPAKLDAKPAAKLDAKLDAKPDGQLEAKPEASPDAKTEAKPDAKVDAGALAARLGIKSAGQATVAPPIGAASSSGLAAAAAPASSTQELSPADVEPVVEMDADSDDDLMIDIVANEPTEAEEAAAALSSATPLPVAIPLSMRDSAEHAPVAPVYPPSPNPLFQVTVASRTGARPIRMTRPVYMRPMHTGLLRMRSTSEGVVVMGPPHAKSGIVRHRASGGVDAMRTTIPQAHPTIPGAVSAIGLGMPGSDHGFLDEALLTFLRREAARPL